MALSLNFILIPLLILAAETDIPLNDRFPDEKEVFQCNFDLSCDANFDAWPDGWTRRHGIGYPSYIKIEIQPKTSPDDGQCFQVDLDGGGAAVFTPPIQVEMLYSYVLEGAIRTEGLKNDRAYYSLTYLDAENRPYVTYESESVVATNGWKKIRLGPIAPPSHDTKLVVIGLHVEPQESEDLKGSAAFADIRLLKLPRLELKTNQSYNLFVAPAKVEVTCTVSGTEEKNPKVNFKLLDPYGRCLVEETRQVEGENTALEAESEIDIGDSTAEKNCVFAWNPPMPGPGFYRVRAELQGRADSFQYRELTLAVIETRRTPSGGGFGWSLPQGSRPIPLSHLASLLSQAGVSLVKYPLWFSDKSGSTALNQILAFGEHLNAEDIELVGLLNNPPEELREQLAPAKSLLAADIFGSDSKLWYSSLEPVLTQLAGLVRRWQLGNDADASFLTAPNYGDKLVEIKKELDRAAQNVALGVGWDYSNDLPSSKSEKKLPLQFVALSSERPLSAKELGAYLDVNKDVAQKRWVSLKPLAKSSNSTSVRVENLVTRMITAKIHGADAIFCPDPFDADCGLMNKDGTPDELFLPWRTAALELAGAKFLGSLQLPRGSQNMVFARDQDAMMVFWNKNPVNEVLYLGEDVKQVDIWGRIVAPEKRENAQSIHADSMPVFVTGLSEPIARWNMDLGFAEQRMPSIFGQTQANSLCIKNSFACKVAGTALIVAPRGWIVTPKEFTLHLAAGEELKQPISLIIPETTGIGLHKIRVDFAIHADKSYTFSVIKHLEVGLGDVLAEIKTRINQKNELEVEQQLINETNQPVNFRCELFAPDRRRLMVQFLNQGRGQKAYTFRLEDGRQLVGEILWLRATEIDGPRTLNYHFTAKE